MYDNLGHYTGSYDIDNFFSPLNIKKVNIKDTLTEQEKLDKGLCPECNEPLKYIGGCVQCPNCGFSRCN